MVHQLSDLCAAGGEFRCTEPARKHEAVIVRFSEA